MQLRLVLTLHFFNKLARVQRLLLEKLNDRGMQHLKNLRNLDMGFFGEINKFEEGVAHYTVDVVDFIKLAFSLINSLASVCRRLHFRVLSRFTQQIFEIYLFYLRLDLDSINFLKEAAANFTHAI